MVNAKKKEIIEELKSLRKEKDITFQEIARRTEENGEAVSLSTIKLVFSDKDKHNHDYNKIIKPIANVLLPLKEDNLEAQTVTSMLEYKNEIIRQLQNRIETKDSKHKDREEFLMDQLAFCKEQIKFKDSQIKRLNEAIDRKDAMIRKYLLNEE